MRIWKFWCGRLSLAMVAALLASCGGGGGSAAATASVPKAATLSAQAALGEKIFNDVSLSASGRQSCASCHDASQAHAPANALTAQLGGPLLDQQGRRSAPSINYLSFNSAFRFEADGTPTGGFFWDGRAASLQAQAAGPFTNPFEMANADVQAVISRLAQASYGDEFKRVFGADILSRPADAMDRVTLALAQYQKEDTDFRPFSSKYDEFLRGKVALSDQELRGLALFNNPSKGNCQACHPSAKAANGSFPLFTDFSFDNLGVPRNPAIARNADPVYFDLGLCERPELASRTDLCGAFKVPSLRNVAKRQVFFHNGRFTSLKEALTFYVQRDTNPEKWYPLNADGSVHKFDDLPRAYVGNVNTAEVPYNRKPGDSPALTDAEVDDVITFLRTLNDGYAPR
ncbi:cytochrome-c peroxidase [Roseateles sp. BYS78W]|uniref:Cytochrome-c peroxidase n=1 Tax=Pelomonas candidula TaxID=3299025 RepID=A0ABW7HJ85_9BURK